MIRQKKYFRAYQVIVVLVVEEVLLGEETAEGGVAKSVGLVGAKLKHGEGVSVGEVERARHLRDD